MIHPNWYKLILSKPKITLLLTFTGVVGYLIPSLEEVKIPQLLMFLFVGFLTSDGALIINYWIDKDIDILMDRTKNRASVGPDAVPNNQIIWIGSIMIAIGLILSFITFGIYTAIQLAWGALFYIFGYSVYLKRKSILNTILGAFASPAPVWAGYAARYELFGWNGDFLGVPWIGWGLGMLVVIWTPSHTWSLSTKNVVDYAAAKIPMVPVKYGLPFTSRVTMAGGIITILYSVFFTYWLSLEGTIGSPLWPIILILISSILLMRGLLAFWKNPSVETGTLSFRDHNKWLSLVFLILLIFSF